MCATHAIPRDDVCTTRARRRKTVADACEEEVQLSSAEAHWAAHLDCATPTTRVSTGNDVHWLYTFDFSQNVCFPHHARNMGPNNFTSLRKV